MHYRHGRILDGSEYTYFVAERVIADHVCDKRGDVELPYSSSVSQQLFYLGGMERTCTHGKQKTLCYMIFIQVGSYGMIIVTKCASIKIQ